MMQLKMLLAFIFTFLLTFVKSEVDFANIRCYHAGDEIQFTERNSRRLKRMAPIFQKGPKELEFGISTSAKDIEIEMEFAVPFITIPLGKGRETGVKLFPADEEGDVEEFKQRSSRKEIMADVNLAAIAFIGLSSLVVTGLSYAFLGLHEKHGRTTGFGSSKNGNLKEVSPVSNAFNRVFEAMDRGMAKFNIDGTSCAQLYVCEAIQKAQKSAITRGGYMDSMIKLLVDSDWVMNQIAGSSIDDAIRLAKGDGDCDAVFSKCKVDYKFANGVQRN